MGKSLLRKSLGCAPISLALCVALAGAYLWGGETAYAATVYPAWVYAIVALLAMALTRPKPFWAKMRWQILGWSLFALLFSEETLPLLRSFSPAPLGGLTVVSVNCAGGAPDVAGEALSTRAELILLQESPSRQELQKLVSGQDYEVVWGVDASILARGALEPMPLPRGTSDFVAAIWTSPAGRRILIISLRLTPPVLRFDYWNPAAWLDYRDNVRKRREELSQIAAFVQQNRGVLPIIMGGDFNAGPRAGLQEAMPSAMEDVFASSGRGWPHTAVNDYPLVRIDQIWASSELEPLTCSVKKTLYSDHRMVIARVAER